MSFLVFQLVRKNVIRSTGELSLSFLIKLTNSIVALREYLKDPNKPVLHLAILSTMIEFYEGIHSQEVSDAAALVERVIAEDIEFKLLNR